MERDGLGELKRRLTGLAGLHNRIANDVVGERKMRLRCDECGHAEPLGADLFARCLQRGWPAHCGHTMKVEHAE